MTMTEKHDDINLKNEIAKLSETSNKSTHQDSSIAMIGEQLISELMAEAEQGLNEAKLKLEHARARTDHIRQLLKAMKRAVG